MRVYFRSALFLIWLALVSVALNIGCLPLLLGPRRWVMAAGRFWARLVLFGLRMIAGLGVEVRGKMPTGPVLLAVKHFSMWETIAIQALFDDPAIVIKRELLRVPFYGWYCRKMKMIAVDRDAGSRALRGMIASAKAAIAERRPVVIFPEGTRREVGAPPDYKPGVAALYTALAKPCVPVALNSGLYWHSWLRPPGKVIIEFLEPIPPGLPRQEFMVRLEAEIEMATTELVAEGRAGQKD